GVPLELEIHPESYSRRNPLRPERPNVLRFCGGEVAARRRPLHAVVRQPHRICSSAPDRCSGCCSRCSTFDRYSLRGFVRRLKPYWSSSTRETDSPSPYECPFSCGTRRTT